jgi:hypothetical protein
MSPSPCPQAGRQVSAKQSQNISLRANPPARCPYSWSRFSKKYASTAGCATRGFPQFASWGSQCTLTDRRTLLREICSSRIRARRRAPSKIEGGSTAAKPSTKPLRRGCRCECPHSARSSMLALAAEAAAARSSIRGLSRTAVSRPDSILGITSKSPQWISAARCSACERSE